MVPKLVDECVRSLRTNIQVENSAQLLYYSDLYELVEFKDEVMEFICYHMKDVMKSTGWKLYVVVKPVLMVNLLEKMAELLD